MSCRIRDWPEKCSPALQRGLDAPPCGDGSLQQPAHVAGSASATRTPSTLLEM